MNKLHKLYTDNKLDALAKELSRYHKILSDLQWSGATGFYRETDYIVKDSVYSVVKLNGDILELSHKVVR